MEDLEYIKKFNKITISKICRKYNLQRPNIVQGTAPKEKIKLVKEEIESEIAKLYLKE